MKAWELKPGDFFDATEAVEEYIEWSKMEEADFVHADSLRFAAENLWFEVDCVEPWFQGRIAVWAYPHNVFVRPDLEVSVRKEV